jgi:hypothetical protein
MPDRNTRASVVVAGMVAVSLGWLLYQMGHPASSFTDLNPHTINTIRVITPGRSIVAYHLFLIAVSLIPPLYFAAALWLPERPLERAATSLNAVGKPVWRYWRQLYLVLFVLGLCGAGVLSGFSWEALNTEVRLSQQALEYRTGARNVRIDWNNVRAVVVLLHGRSQVMDVGDSSEIMRIDLSEFSMPDREMLVKQVPKRARLSLIQHSSEGLVWKRTSSPTEGPQENPEPMAAPAE